MTFLSLPFKKKPVNEYFIICQSYFNAWDLKFVTDDIYEY